MHEHNHAVQGSVVFLLFAVGTITQLLASRFPSRPVVLAGFGSASTPRSLSPETGARTG